MAGGDSNNFSSWNNCYIFFCVIILIIISAAVHIFLYHRGYKELVILHNREIEILGGVMEEHDRQFRLAGANFEMIKEEIGGVKEGLRQGKEDSGRIIKLLYESFFFTCVESGLAAFREGNYTMAYEIFTRALKYRSGDTTVKFYQIYSFYLGAAGRGIGAADRQMIFEAVIELERLGFRAGERLDFSEDEMRRRVSDIAYNVVEFHGAGAGDDL